MMNDKKQEPTETELIAWAVPQIAEGNYLVTDRASDRELRINDRMATVKEMEQDLSHRASDPRERAVATQALKEMCETCNFQTIKAAFIAVLGKGLGALASQQFEDASPSYDLALVCQYHQKVKFQQRYQMRHRSLRARGHSLGGSSERFRSRKPPHLYALGL